MIVKTLPRVLIVSSPNVDETRWKIRAVDKKGECFESIILNMTYPTELQQ